MLRQNNREMKNANQHLYDIFFYVKMCEPIEQKGICVLSR